MKNVIEDMKAIFALMISMYLFDVVIESFIPYWQSFGSSIFRFMIIIVVAFRIADIFHIMGEMRT